MKELFDFTKYLSTFDLTSRQIGIYNGLIVAFIFLFLSVIAFIITRYVVVQIVKTIILKSKNDYDDVFVKQKVFDALAHIIPAIIFFWGVKFISTYQETVVFLNKIIFSYLVFAALIVIYRFLNSINGIYELYAHKRRLSIQIKQFIQVFKIIFGLAALILIISILLHKKPGAILAGLGAMTAVLMLVFKDSIISLVASIQITAYKLVVLGDWITVPGRQVDGDVMDISLNTIKVRNFDKTISTIPTYALVQESFVNWRGMEQSGGRRIKRAINIDMNSIKLCDKYLIENLSKIELVRDYISEKTEENLKLYSSLDDRLISNSSALTNLGIFRKYIENYLQNNLRIFKKYQKEKFFVDDHWIERFVIDDFKDLHDKFGNEVNNFISKIDNKFTIINTEKFLLFFENEFILENDNIYRVKKVKKQIIVNGVELEVEDKEKIIDKNGNFCDDLTVTVRQLQPTETGLPLEIYAFAATTEWKMYETIQFELFDHLLAVLHEFDLRVFQKPSSFDVKDIVFKSK